MSFDYGADLAEGASGFKQPEVGQALARVRSIIHLGLYEKVWKGKAQKPASYVAVIFELQDQYEEDGETPITTSKMFPLIKGKKALLTKFKNAIDPHEKASGFDDFIGLPVMLNMEGSKEKDDDGNPKFVNATEISGIPKIMEAVLASSYPELLVTGVGHVPFDKLTKEAVEELHPLFHVANTMIKGINYKGSVAEQVVNEIRKDNPDFATASTSADKPKASKDDDMEEELPPPDMDENQEY